MEQGQLSLNADQKYCRMLQVEHSAILSTIIKRSVVIKIFVLSIFEWPFYTGFYCTQKPPLTLYTLKDSSFWFNALNLGWGIVYTEGSQVKITTDIKMYFCR